MFMLMSSAVVTEEMLAIVTTKAGPSSGLAISVTVNDEIVYPIET